MSLLHGPEVVQDQVAWVSLCLVGGTLSVEGVVRRVGHETVIRRTDEPTDRDAPTLGGFLCLPWCINPGNWERVWRAARYGMRASSVLCLPSPPFLAWRSALSSVLLVFRPVKTGLTQTHARNRLLHPLWTSFRNLVFGKKSVCSTTHFVFSENLLIILQDQISRVAKLEFVKSMLIKFLLDNLC